MNFGIHHNLPVTRHSLMQYPFPQKLWVMVNTNEFDFMQWNSSGTVVQVNPEKLQAYMSSPESVFIITTLSAFCNHMEQFQFQHLFNSDENESGVFIMEFYNENFQLKNPEKLVKVRRPPELCASPMDYYEHPPQAQMTDIAYVMDNSDVNSVSFIDNNMSNTVSNGKVLAPVHTPNTIAANNSSLYVVKNRLPSQTKIEKTNETPGPLKANKGKVSDMKRRPLKDLNQMMMTKKEVNTLNRAARVSLAKNFLNNIRKEEAEAREKKMQSQMVLDENGQMHPLEYTLSYQAIQQPMEQIQTLQPFELELQQSYHEHIKSPIYIHLNPDGNHEYSFIPYTIETSTDVTFETIQHIFESNQQIQHTTSIQAVENALEAGEQNVYIAPEMIATAPVANEDGYNMAEFLKFRQDIAQPINAEAKSEEYVTEGEYNAPPQ